MTADRLLILAIVLTLISIDGGYRAWKQRSHEQIGKRLFYFYMAILLLGSALAWIGFFLRWLG